MNRIYFIVVILASLIGNAACSNGGDNPDNPPAQGDVTLYVTTNTRSQDFKKQAVNFSNEQSAEIITLNPNQHYQTMDGFGAAITGSTAYNLMQMAQADRTQFLKETFSPTEGMGYSYVRVPIGCSDFSLSEYTCWDNQATGFGLTDEETKYVIPILKEILAINPTLKIISAPWTCPRWMKTQNTWTSGHLQTQYYTDYANYFVKWIQAFQQNGVPIYSVTPQNEPLNDGNSASLHMDWNEERDFVNNNLVPAFKAAGLKTKIYIWDHNYNNNYPLLIYQAGGLDDNYVVGSAWHDYAGSVDALNSVHNQYPNKELIFTESSIGTWNDGRNFAVHLNADMENLALGTVNRWCRAVIVWNLMLDNNGAPNRPGGCNTCYGAVDINQANYKDLRKNSHYYIIGHLAAVVKPGATRIGSINNNTSTNLVYSAFVNTDGSYALVLSNGAAESKKITVTDGTKRFTHTVPSNSVVSYQWK